MTSAKLALSLFLTCSLGSLALTVEANPAAQTRQPSGAETNRLKVDLDTTGIAKTTKVEIVKKTPFEPGDEIIQLNGEPMHVRIIFDGKKIDDHDNNNYNRPHLLIYPLSQYAALYPADRKVIFNKRISDLKKMIATKSDKGIESLPIMPESDAHEVFHQQEKYLKFNQGNGVAFISSYSNGDPAMNEDDFFYTFQGLTADGKHYVSFFWPVKATGMPANSTESNAQKFVHNLAREKFRPSLDTLDKMVSSISLN